MKNEDPSSRARLAFAADDIVGESIIWYAAEGALYWVDIVGSRIHRLEPESGAHQCWPTPELATSIGLRAKGGFIVGLRHRVARWQPGGPFETLAVPEPDRPRNRLNEGVVAPDGSFWVGTMEDNIGPDLAPRPVAAAGALYRITADGTSTRLSADEFGITNTMIWMDDGRFVTADTLANVLYQYETGTDGGLHNRRPFHEGLRRGVPDGSARDRAGNIYNCRVGGGAAIAVLSPAGDLLRFLDLPCASPTSCAFGGPELRQLYVTSSRFGMTAAEIAARPQEGGLFVLDLDEAGLLPNTFAG
jgi:sugar lactone lactonase YvrE